MLAPLPTCGRRGHPLRVADGSPAVQRIARDSEGQAGALRHWRPEIPEALERLCLQCLRGRPGSVRSAEELAEGLRGFLTTGHPS
jgi:hypothetical protein